MYEKKQQNHNMTINERKKTIKVITFKQKNQKNI